MKPSFVSHRVVSGLLLAAFAGTLVMTGCTKRPSKEELSTLDEACAAAKAAEKKLEDLKQERMALESELESKKTELSELETQRDAIKTKLEESMSDDDAGMEETVD